MALIATGLQLSGYTDIRLAILCWVTAGILAVWLLVGFIRQRRLSRATPPAPPPPVEVPVEAVPAPAPLGTVQGGLQPHVLGTPPVDEPTFELATWPRTTIEARFRLRLTNHTGEPILVEAARLVVRAGRTPESGRTLSEVELAPAGNQQPVRVCVPPGFGTADVDVEVAEWGDGEPAHEDGELLLALHVAGRAEPLEWKLRDVRWRGDPL
jgi:hypothetical protein